MMTILKLESTVMILLAEYECGDMRSMLIRKTKFCCRHICGGVD